MVTEYLKSILTVAEQDLYKKMYEAFSTQKSRVECKGYSQQSIVKVYAAVYHDHPELFYLSYAPQLATTFSFMGKILTLISESIYSHREISQFNTKIEEIKRYILSKAASCKNQKDKELCIIDFLIENTLYEIDHKYHQNAASVLVNKKGQCSGISKAVKLLCDHLGIECIVVEGTGFDESMGLSGAHAWNIVKIDGKYYHLDVTFMIGANLSKRKPFRYLFFNASDVEFEKNHTWERKKYPKCNTSGATHVGEPCIRSTSPKDTHRIDPSKKIITSMFFFRGELSNLIREKGRELTFISKIKSKESDDLASLYLNEAVAVAKAKGIAVSINVCTKGKEVTISLSWK